MCVLPDVQWVLLKTGLYKLNGGSGRRHAGPHTPAGPTTHPLEHTKIKVSPLTGLQMEKNMFFVIPDMPSKTFVMG